MTVPRGGPNAIWAFLYRAKLVRAHMPYWRVVVEAKLDRDVRSWPRHLDGAVAAIFVWARTIEEAEGLAALALEDEGLEAITADAKKMPPAAAPQRLPAAVSRTDLGFLPRLRNAAPAKRPGARA